MEENIRLTKCRKCGQEIFFIKTHNFKNVPVNPEPVWVRYDNQGIPYIQIGGNTVTGFEVGDAYDTDIAVAKAYVSHMTTCPEALKERQGKKARKARPYRKTVF